MDFPNDSEGCKQVNRSLGRLAALFPGDCNIFPRCLLAAIEKQPRAGQPADRLWDANPNAGDARTCKVPSFADFQAADSSGKVDVTAMEFSGGHALTVAFRVRQVTFDTASRNWLYIGPDQNQNAAGSKLELRPYLDGGEKRIRIVVGGGSMLSAPLPATDWLNVQVVVPPGAHMTDIKLYVNGNVLATTPESGDDPLMDIAGQTMYINGNPSGADLSAAYAHFKLWDYALTPQQLQDVSDYKRDWWPVIDYPMEERDGLLLYNRAKNADHMTLTANVVRQDDDAHELPFSYTEFFGWSPGPSGERIPSAAWDPSKDAIGGALQHRGPCPRDAQLNPDGTINFRGDGATKNTTWWRALSWTVPNAFDPAADTLPPQIQETDEYYLIVDCDAPQYLLTHGKPAPEATAVILAPSNVETDTPVSLSATGSTGTPDDPIVSYHWEFGDGQGGSGASVQHTYTSEGQKTVTLTVVTQQGRTATSQASINVSAPVPNLPPVAVINGPDSVTQGNSANFQGTGSSDPDGTIVGYEWTLPDGTKSTNPMATYVFNDLGDQTLTLKVTDDNGATGTTTKTVSVTAPANQPPTVTIEGAEAVDVGESQMYLAQATDPDGTIASTEWTLPDGSTQSGALITYEFKAPAGDQTLSVTVTDNDGATATATKTVTVAAPNQPPTAVITGPDEIVIGTSHTYNALGSSDPDGSIASFEWTFPDGSTADTPSAAYTFLGPAGDQTVTLTVTDNDGATDTTTKTVNVLARPIVSISWPTNDVTVGQPLTLDASGSSSPNGDITCTWDFGDGSPEATGCVQTHTFASEGSYTVTLTVTDEKGATNVSQSHLSVVAPASGDPPDAQIWGADMVVPGESWTWDATDSTDSDGTIAATTWEIQPDGVTGSDEAITFTPDDTGERTITLTVRDNDGNETQDIKTVQVVEHFPDFDGNTWQEPAAPRFWTNLNDPGHSMGFWPRRFQAMGIPLHLVKFYTNAMHNVPDPVDPPYNWHLIRQTVLDFDVPGTALRAIDIEKWQRTTAKLPDHKRIIKEIRAAWADGDKKSPLVAYGHGWMSGSGEIDGIGYNPVLNAMQMRRINGAENHVAVPGYKGAILTAEYYHPFVANEFFYLTPTLYCNQTFTAWQEFAVQAMDYLWTRYPDAKIVPWVSIKNYSTNTFLTNDECREAGLMWRAMRHRLHGLICFNAMNHSNPKPTDETIVDTFIQAYLTG